MFDFGSLSTDKVLALTIFGEARGESIEGMVAVGSVVKNRSMISKRTIKSICLQPKQFSCFNATDPNFEVLSVIANKWDEYLETNKYLRQCYWIAKGILDSWLISNVRNATHYHHIAIKPKWSINMDIVTRIGAHQFYYDKNWR